MTPCSLRPVASVTTPLFVLGCAGMLAALGCSGGAAKGSDGKTSAASTESASAKAAPAPEPKPTASTPKPAAAAPSASRCRELLVDNARDERGAPLWPTSHALGATYGKAAPARAAVGQPVRAKCQLELGGRGYGVCVRNAAGQSGWLHHERLIGSAVPSQTLSSLLQLPTCASTTCDASECSP